MSFPRYPKYKDSGVEWLGAVPDHWKVLPCRGIVQERAGRNDGAECQDYLSLMANVGVIPYADKGDVGNKKPEDLSKCKIVTRGDFVINSMNYGIGSYGLSDYDGVCSPVYIVLKPQNDVVESRFAFRIFENKAFQTFAQSFGNGILAHRCSINWDILKSIRVGIPPTDEQKAILAFLDRETAKIDGLVAEQRRLMELLKEKRQAVISHAVTKGLNPDAPMKPSGIEWLGDVPAHWETSRLKHATSRIVDCPHETPTLDDEGEYLTIRTADIDEGEIFPEQMRRVDEKEYRKRIRREPVLSDDIVYSREGGRWGHAALVPDDDRFCLGQRMMQFRANDQFLPAYLMWHLNATNVYVQGDLDTVGAASPHVNVGTICNYRIAAPSPEEQDKIVDFLCRTVGEINALTAEAQRAIDLLQERRTALISAAVTGQIDVRQLATREDAA